MFLKTFIVNKNAWFKHLCLVAIWLVSGIALASPPPPSKTVYSRSSPSVWTTGTNWSSSSGGGSCGCTPDESKDVIYVERNTSSAAGLSFGSAVTLRVRNNSTLTINGNVTFENGAIVIVEAGSSIVINGNLTNNNNSDQIAIDGALSVSGNFTGGNGSSVVGTGSMAVAGTATTSGSGTVFGSNGSCSGCTISTSNPLPVEFLGFDAVANNNEVSLTWSTATEFNSDYFIVQRSQDGSGFTDGMRVDAAGNSATVKNYFSIDTEPYEGVSYYRLKQVDFNGEFMYSDVVTVKLHDYEGFSVYPNPANGPFQVNILSGRAEEKVLIVIRDVLGKEFYSEVFLLSSGKETIVLDHSAGLLPGVYLVTASSDDRIFEKKIVIR